MKKIIALLTLAVVLALPVVSLAQPESIPTGCTMKYSVGVAGCPTTGWCGEDGCSTAERWGICCMLNTIYTVTTWIFYILTLVAVLMIVFGGFTYIAAAGDPAKAGKGKSILVFAIIGLAIALIAKIIPTLVRFILGV